MSVPGPSAAADVLFGTRNYTAGAEIQLPRKIPLRIEPKTYFANERTLLAWLSMATTLGTVSTAIAGFAVESDEPGAKHKGSISDATVELVTLLLIPVSILMSGYALFTFYARSESFRRKQVGYFDDHVGPLVLAVIIIVVLLVILIAALRDVFGA